MKYFSLKLFNTLAIVASICACGGRDTAGGISEETEGVAINNKTIEGVSQKGPFAKGSSVFLKETKADGSLTPTGKEFYATIRNDAGEFKIENINLESQYALLTAEGFYKRESTGEFSDCAISLNAITDISKRNSTNINLLTHFEYQRILNLFDSGIPFKNAKAQAEKEIFAQFGFEKHESAAEDLDITGKTEEDRILHEISKMIDKAFYVGGDPAPCLEVSTLIDSIANDFSADGIINDDLLSKMAGYNFAFQKSNASSIISRLEKLGTCNQANLNQCDKLQTTITVKALKSQYAPDTIVHYDHAICSQNGWYLIADKQYEEASKEIEHKTSSMTDPRDGKTYKTTSFTTGGKTYEWMAENLQFAGISATPNEENKKGIYTRAEALLLEDSVFIKRYQSVLNGTDSVYQGICPENWHIPNTKEWKALIKFVGSPSKLYSKDWNKIHFTNRILGDNIEFGAVPTFFERIAETHDSFVPYANFIAFTPIAIKDNYSSCTADSQASDEFSDCQGKDYDLDYGSEYIDEHEPIKLDQIFSILLGSTNRLMGFDENVSILYSFPWNTSYKAFKHNELNLKYNVRCIKD